MHETIENIYNAIAELRAFILGNYTMFNVVLRLLLKVPFKFQVYSRNYALVAKASRLLETYFLLAKISSIYINRYTYIIQNFFWMMIENGRLKVLFLMNFLEIN